MKTRTISLLVILTATTLCLFGCADRTPAESEPTTSNPPAVDTTVSSSGESLSQQLVRDIEDAYKKEQELPDNQTTIGMVELAGKYRGEWKKVADKYYNLLMEFEYPAEILPHEMEYYSTDNLRGAVSAMKTDWEAYYEAECENYRTTLLCIYGPGTIVGPILADYQYQMYKDWALKLVGIYEQLA